jgi:Uma2 family endonuclease
MAEIGILGEDDRVELLRGEIFELSPIGTFHNGTVTRLIHVFSKIVGDRALVTCQDPVRIEDHSEPQPDIALVKAREDFYTSRHPGPEDTLLLIEVSDSSLAKDRGLKMSIYAEAGFPEYWIIDVKRGVVEVYRQPSGERYEETFELEPGKPLALVALEGIEVTREDLIGS